MVKPQKKFPKKSQDKFVRESHSWMKDFLEKSRRVLLEVFQNISHGFQGDSAFSGSFKKSGENSCTFVGYHKQNSWFQEVSVVSQGVLEVFERVSEDPTQVTFFSRIT